MIFWFCILKDAQKKLKEVEKELKKQIELQPVWDATVKGLHQDLRKRNKEVRDKYNYIEDFQCFNFKYGFISCLDQRGYLDNTCRFVGVFPLSVALGRRLKNSKTYCTSTIYAESHLFHFLKCWQASPINIIFYPILIMNMTGSLWNRYLGTLNASWFQLISKIFSIWEIYGREREVFSNFVHSFNKKA